METTGVTRRSFLQAAVGTGLAASTSGLPLVAEGTGAVKRLNILYLHSHDSGRYLSPYGYPVPTPSLTELAKEGVLFRQAFAAAPTCSPSRACLLSGECAHNNGMLGLAHLGFRMNDYKRTLIGVLNDTGYNTVLAGLQHIAPTPEMIGYKELLPHKSTRAADVAPGAVAFLNGRPREPFFLDVGFFENHRFEAGQPHGYPENTPLDNPNYVMPPATFPDTADTRKDIAGYHATARGLDAGIAAVLGALKANGLAENTLVISTTDHGIPFPDMKCNLVDAGTGVSLILRGPGVFQGGTVCDAMVSHMDVFPTLCDVLQIAKPAWLQGKSFLPVLQGAKEQINEELFAEVNYHAAYEPKRCVRTARWKYIRRFDGRTTAVLPNCDDGWTKDLWLKNGWHTNPLESEESLYDLVFDATERNNLVASPAHKEALAEMRGRLDRWMKVTKDPLLHGPIPLPKGARTTNPDALTYKDKSAAIIGT